MPDPVSSLFSDPFAPAQGPLPGEIGRPTPPPTSTLFSDPREADRLTDATRRATSVTPDRAARVLALERRTGLPADLIDRNLDDVERQAAASDFDVERFRRESPLLAQWLAAHPMRMALAGDDLRPLSTIEQTLGVARNLVGAGGAGLMDFARGIYGALQAGYETGAFGPYGAKPAAAFVRGSADVAGDLASRARGPQTGAGFVMRNVYGGLEAATSMLPALAAGAVLGPEATVATFSTTAGGGSYTHARAEGLSQAKSLAFGGASGAIAAATSFIPASRLLGDVAANAPFVTVLAHHITSAIPAQEIQTALDDLNAWAFLPENQNKPFRAYLAERPSAAAASLIAAITAVGIHATATHGAAQVFDRLGNAARSSTTIKRAPEDARDLVTTMTADSPAATVQLPIDAFTDYFQSRQIDPAGMAERLTGDPHAFARAQQTGEDLAVPMGRYLTDIAATEHHAFFQNEARLQPDTLNPRELRELQTQAAQLATTPEPDTAVSPAVLDQLREQAQALFQHTDLPASVSRIYSELLARGFSVLGTRAGVDPLALFNRFGLRVERVAEPAPAEGTALSQSPLDVRRAQLEARITEGRQRGREDVRAVQELQELEDQASRGAGPTTSTESAAPVVDARSDPHSPDFLRQDERARIVFGPDGQTRIELFRHADLSSFLHETGHLYLHALNQVVGDLGAPETLTEGQRQLRADHDALLQWLGVGSAQDITREHHEQFARAFEAYLFEGRAPAPTLRPVFARIRSWLVSVYRSIRSLDVELTPAIRDVFDRLLATDDAIAAAQRESRVSPGDARDMAHALRLDPASRAAFDRTVAAATEAARARVQATLLADLRREQQTWWKDERARVREAVAREVSANPVYRALAWLQRGTEPSGAALPEGVTPFKLDAETLREQFGPAILDRLPKPLVYAKDGVTPDIAADLLGFPSGEALIRALTSTPPMDAAIDAATDAEMRRRHGDVIADGTLEADARAAVLDAGAEVFAEELKLLAKAVTREPGQRSPSVPTVASIRAIAEQRIASTSVRELRPGIFAAAARRAGERALRAATSQDFKTAFEHKQQQVLSAELQRAASDARTTVDRALDLFRTIRTASDGKLAETRNLDYVYAARAVLAEFGLGRADSRVEDYLRKIRAYDPDGHDQLIALVDAAPRGSGGYKDLAMADFRGLAESVEALWTLSRTTEEMEVRGERRKLADLRRDVLGRIEQFREPREQPGLTRAVTKWDKAKDLSLGLRARLRRIEDWVTVQDNARDGLVRNALFDPINDGAVRYEAARSRIATEFARLVDTLHGQVTDRKIDAPEIGYTFNGTRELLGALLHTGNGFEPGSNGDKLLRGRTWGALGDDGRVDMTRWRAFVDRMQREGVLQKPHFDFVQATWDLLESMKPDAQRTHHARFGRYFDEVTAVPFETHYGHYRGGYFPAIANPFITPVAAERAEANALLEGGAGGALMFPSVNRGFAQTRNPAYARPLILDASLVLSHLNSVLRFTHLSQPVHDVSRLIMHPAFRDRMNAIDPGVVSDLLVPYLHRAASQQLYVPLQGRAGRAADLVARWLRERGAMQLVALNPTVIGEQLTHFPAVFAHPDVTTGGVLSALWRLSRQPRALARTIHELSPYMATRESAGLVEARAAIDRVLLDPNPAEHAAQWARDHATVVMRGIQAVMDLATWQAVYDKVAAEPNVTHDEAVRRADGVVRQVLGSYRPQDRAAIEGGAQIMGLLNPFYGFFGTKLNMLGTEAALASRLGLRPRYRRALALYTFGFMVPALLGAAIKNLTHGKSALDHGGNDDEDAASALFHFWGLSQIEMASRMVPFGGKAAELALHAFSGSHGTPGSPLINMPAVKMAEDALSAPGEVYHALAEEQTAAQQKKTTTDFFTLMGMLVGLPLRPVGQAVNTAQDALNGE